MSLTEEAVGMAPVQAQIIECVFRERYSDFVVREVGPDGAVARSNVGSFTSSIRSRSSSASTSPRFSSSSVRRCSAARASARSRRSFTRSDTSLSAAVGAGAG